ncbi:hypothetical protein [Gandjariella thermophila]|uniref:Uncharacterized protein n=1 Tax=Gandjariella thermophila TaxID=1931992 RepID=A0A4D4J7G7_9PSEU|nr:hypothetical protein [Gandjariella thermophila]GDY30466.1 hypothetical protein GTS_20990 [Gandjariella thermophila]
MQEIFKARERLVDDYRSFTSAFIDVRNERIAAHVRENLDRGTQWPDPWLSQNPNFASRTRASTGPMPLLRTPCRTRCSRRYRWR